MKIYSFFVYMLGDNQALTDISVGA
jgi:hypothetical protein